MLFRSRPSRDPLAQRLGASTPIAQAHVHSRLAAPWIHASPLFRVGESLRILFLPSALTRQGRDANLRRPRRRGNAQRGKVALPDAARAAPCPRPRQYPDIPLRHRLAGAQGRLREEDSGSDETAFRIHPRSRPGRLTQPLRLRPAALFQMPGAVLSAHRARQGRRIPRPPASLSRTTSSSRWAKS